jgi:hypothetical protein
MHKLPNENKLQIENLTSVFTDITNSYKFYWFVAILDEIKDKNNNVISIQKLCFRMLSEAWYPLNFYRLSFGKADSFKIISDFVNENTEIDLSINSDPLIQQIEAGLDFKAKLIYEQKLKTLKRWVPYRFIRPFFAKETRGLSDSKVNVTIYNLSNYSAKNNPEYCPYYFVEDKIIITQPWFEYFINNIGLLKGFTYWHLIRFLQKNNPNVPGISEKIFKPTRRNLGKYIDGWKRFLEYNTYEKCIYSDKKIINDFTVDHFIPWSFVTHDLNWNLVPVSKRINSSKGDRLPNLEKYIEPFSRIQYFYFQTMFENKIEIPILEEYCLLFNLSLNELARLPKNVFKKKIAEVITPMEQIASNMGFQKGWESNIEN